MTATRAPEEFQKMKVPVFLPWVNAPTTRSRPSCACNSYAPGTNGQASAGRHMPALGFQPECFEFASGHTNPFAADDPVIQIGLRLTAGFAGAVTGGPFPSDLKLCGDVLDVRLIGFIVALDRIAQCVPDDSAFVEFHAVGVLIDTRYPKPPIRLPGTEDRFRSRVDRAIAYRISTVEGVGAGGCRIGRRAHQ